MNRRDEHFETTWALTEKIHQTGFTIFSEPELAQHERKDLYEQQYRAAEQLRRLAQKRRWNNDSFWAGVWISLSATSTTLFVLIQIGVLHS